MFGKKHVVFGLQDYSTRINSLDFHRSADLLVTAGNDDSIKLYGLETGDSHKLLHSKKYGISHVNFTHHPSAIVFASNKVRLKPSPYLRPLHFTSAIFVEENQALTCGPIPAGN